MDSKKINAFLKKETFLVALTTALCYTGSYAYERGFSYYYGIPTELITVTPSSIITAVSLFFVFLIVVYISSNLPISISRNKKIKNKYIIVILTLSPIWIFLNLIFFLLSGFSIFHLSVITAGFILLCIGITFTVTESVTQGRAGGVDKQKNFFTIIDDVTAIIFLLSFAFFSITTGTGTFIARTTDNFNTFTYNNVVYNLIKSYGDNIIAIKSKDTNTPKGIYIFRAEDLREIRINQVKTKVHYMTDNKISTVK